jgi:hypothetical protein
MAILKIKKRSLPSRCEVCHKSDRFDPEKNHCSRCENVDEAILAAGGQQNLTPELRHNLLPSVNRKFRMAIYTMVVLLTGLILGAGLMKMLETDTGVTRTDTRRAQPVKIEQIATPGQTSARSNEPKIDYSQIPLFKAAQNGDTGNLKRLLAAGADTNMTDTNGITALMLAADNNHIEAVKLLLAAGALVDMQNNVGGTALMCATQYGYTEVARVLIAAGADLLVKNNNGWTALMWAANNGHTETVKELIDAGSNINAESKSGSTALDCAKLKRHMEVVRVLKEAGAR